jgi:hypothetical protein
VITYRLTNLFIEWGLVQPTRQMGNTLFGIKPPGADFARFDLAECERVIAGVESERDAALNAATS